MIQIFIFLYNIYEQIDFLIIFYAKNFIFLIFIILQII